MSLISVPNDLHDAIEALRHDVTGDVLVAGQDGFAEACLAWNVRHAHVPDVVVVAASAADVAFAVRFAHAAGCPITVQATGHGFSRAATEGVLIVTSQLTEVTIDRRTLTARVACGATWGAVLVPAQQHGLAPLLGSSTGVGAVGYTLGGGMGWLGRRYGLASDSVRSFEVVIADGTEVHASASENPELFWALRGGGGSFGVVTAMTIELYPVGMVYAGNLLYPIGLAAEVITRYSQWVEEVDPQLTSSVVIMNFPPLDAVPEPLRGRSFVIVRGCWSGDLGEGAALVDEWRAWRQPEFDMFGPMPFGASDAISNDPVDPMPTMMTTEWFDALTADAIDIIVAAAAPSTDVPPMLAFAEIRHAGGAIRTKAAAAANGRSRTGEFLLGMCGVVFGPEHGAALAAHLAGVRTALAPMATGAAYPNFIDGEEKHQRSATSFSTTSMARLQGIKDAVDGDNQFRNALAIEPTVAGGR